MLRRPAKAKLKRAANKYGEPAIPAMRERNVEEKSVYETSRGLRIAAASDTTGQRQTVVQKEAGGGSRTPVQKAHCNRRTTAASL